LAVHLCIAYRVLRLLRAISENVREVGGHAGAILASLDPPQARCNIVGGGAMGQVGWSDNVCGLDIIWRF